MGVKSAMQADEAVFMNLDDFAETASFLAQEARDTPFNITVVPSDISSSMSEEEMAHIMKRIQVFMVWRSRFRSAIDSALSKTRDPRRGDTISFASGEYAGEWDVQYAEADNGGMITVTCTSEFPEETVPDGAMGTV